MDIEQDLPEFYELNDLDASETSDEILVFKNGEFHMVLPENVEGPDPAVWGEDQCKPASLTETRENVEGPDPEVWGVRE